MKAGYKLSKSTFIRGLQCEKSLYLYKHHYKLKDPIPVSLQTVFDQGNKVGILAQGLFPGGVDASPENYFKIAEAAVKTKDLIANGNLTIYEATFIHNEVLAALDILVKEKSGWVAYEVKSSTKISPTYIKDAAIQYHTIVNSGIDLKDIFIVHISNQYTRNGDLNIHELFSIESVKDQVLEYIPRIHNEVNRLKSVIQRDSIPDIKIGSHCTDPYDCDFIGTCWKDVPEYSVFNIQRLSQKRKFELYNKGVTTLNQIDLEKEFLNSNQVLQIKSEVEGEAFIDENQIKGFIDHLNYPLYFLDFETFGPAIPVYNNSRPYQQLVFQYSLHIQDSEDSELTHEEYLADPKSDPRVNFIKQLIKNCGSSGDIIVYNIGFERGKLEDLANVFPEYSDELNGIIHRLKDLMIPFQKKWYYTPGMKGSYSIKKVLPALVPDMSYDDLEIKEGGTASNTFLSMVNGSFAGDEKHVRKQLLEYCKLDTLAMVKILDRLREI